MKHLAVRIRTKGGVSLGGAPGSQSVPMLDTCGRKDAFNPLKIINDWSRSHFRESGPGLVAARLATALHGCVFAPWATLILLVSVAAIQGIGTRVGSIFTQANTAISSS